MRLPNPNKLLVEGDEDKRVIPQLIEANGIRWGERRDQWPVEIEAVGGIDELLRPGSIRAELGQRNLQRLGILLDADTHPTLRWQRVRAECVAAFPDLPATPPPEGTIARNQEGKSLGVWLMPDNQSRGMLETFLAYLVPGGGSALWAYAQEVVVEARQRAPYHDDGRRDVYRDAHLDKAAIHTWLAWQDPPGAQLHHAVLQKMLDPRARHAQPFVTWFRRLYEL
jgi:hypothetical protein